MLNCKYISWNVIFLLFLSSLWTRYFLLFSWGFRFMKEDQSLLQEDGGKNKNPITLCAIKAMIEKSGCVDLEFT